MSAFFPLLFSDHPEGGGSDKREETIEQASQVMQRLQL